MSKIEIPYNPRIFLLPLLLIACFGTAYLTAVHFPQYVYVGVAMIALAISIIVFIVTDKILFPEISGQEQVQKNNQTYGMVLIAIAIIIHAAMSML